MKQTTEDYLKSIFLLQSNQGEARNSKIAELLGVSKPTVTNRIKRLVRDGYVIIKEDLSIELTEDGRDVAESTLERNRTIRNLLTGLGVDKTIAEADACAMEHTVSPESLTALKKLAESIN